MKKVQHPHIILTITRREAVRNFLCSEAISLLNKQARVTLLSEVHNRDLVEQFQPYIERIVSLRGYCENIYLCKRRERFWHTHSRWQWTEKVKTKWIIDNGR